jgi:very-short-patch-repair endonuclease
MLEVDGYAYHWAPEAKAYDDSRRNRLMMEGWRILVYSWMDIVREGSRVLAEINETLAMRAGVR